MLKISNNTEKSLGIIALMLGVFVIALLFIDIFTFSQIIGIGISFIGVWLLILSIDTRKHSRIESIVYLIPAIISITAGLGLYINLNLYWIYEYNLILLTGLIIIITGIIAFLGPNKAEKIAGTIGIVLGILFTLIYFYTRNLYILAIITGIWLMVIGIIQFVITYEETG